MPKLVVVTDSTSGIPRDLLAKYEITLAPQVLIWDNQTLYDGVDIQPEEFYTRIKTAKNMPTTSQVSVASMEEIFRKQLEKADEVIGIFLSTKLSGTIQSATQARELLGLAGEKIHIVDSNSVSMAMGFQVLATARAIEGGATVSEAIAVAERARDHTGVFFAVDTLEFLHRGGRIGGAARFLGTALNLKPVLAVQDGRVEAIERIRTKSKAVERVIELVAEQVKGQSPIHLATLHAHAAQEARELLERASQGLNPVESLFTEVSPVVGNHAGPGTVGLAYMAGM